MSANNNDRTYQLYLGVSIAMLSMQKASEASEKVDWFADSTVAPHLDTAAQCVFVALNRLETELVKRYGEDFAKVLNPEPEYADTQSA